MAQDDTKGKMIEAILEKLQQMSPAYIRKVMYYATSLLNIQKERKP